MESTRKLNERGHPSVNKGHPSEISIISLSIYIFKWIVRTPWSIKKITLQHVRTEHHPSQAFQLNTTTGVKGCSTEKLENHGTQTQRKALRATHDPSVLFCCSAVLRSLWGEEDVTVRGAQWPTCGCPGTGVCLRLTPAGEKQICGRPYLSTVEMLRPDK